MKWSCSCWATTQQEADSFLQQIQLKEFTSGITQTWTLQAPRGPWSVDGIESSLKLTLPPTINVDVKNRFGNVTIAGSDATIKLINMYGDITAKNLSGKCELENSFGAINVEEVGECRIKNNQGNTTVSDVTGMLDATNSFGQLNVAGVEGAVMLENNKGNITAENIAGKATIKTGFATLRVDGVTGDVNLTNSNGRIFAENLMGSTARIVNSFGPIEIETSATSVECTNQNGKIEVELTNPELLNATLSTKFNDLLVHLPSTMVPNLKLDAGAGKITSEFEGGLAGSAAPVVEATTENGNVIVKRIPTE